MTTQILDPVTTCNTDVPSVPAPTPRRGIPQISSALARRDDGIWESERRREISHPEVCQDWYREVETRSYWYQHRARCIVDLMQRYPPAGAVFDIGGGNGSVSTAMQHAGYSPVLVEPSLSAAQTAKSRGLRDVICSTLQDACFQSGTLPAIGLFDVLEHIQDDHGFLQDLATSLRYDGRLYLTVPSYPWLWSEHDERVGHFRRYTLRSVRCDLERAGYQVEFSTYLFAALTAPVLAFRTLPYRVLGGGRGSRETFAKEHAGGGMLSRGVELALAAERRWLNRGWTLPMGTSCLVVAHKK